MKKLFVLASLLSIVISLSLSFSCQRGYFCCEERHSSTTQCSTCAGHLESSIAARPSYSPTLFRPEVVGKLFFRLIHIEESTYIPRFERPPTSAA